MLKKGSQEKEREPALTDKKCVEADAGKKACRVLDRGLSCGKRCSDGRDGQMSDDALMVEVKECESGGSLLRRYVNVAEG